MSTAIINRDFYDMMPAEADAIRENRYLILTANGAYYAKGKQAAWNKTRELLATVATWADIKQDWDGKLVWSSK
jgi:hypothetical protein